MESSVLKRSFKQHKTYSRLYRYFSVTVILDLVNTVEGCNGFEVHEQMNVRDLRTVWLDVSVWYVVRFDTKRGQVTRGNVGSDCHPVGQCPC
jgi:hypothetical protein